MQISNQSEQIAQTILAQLGGGRFIAMTGSKNFMAMGDGLRMDLAKNQSRANRLRITLRADDTYDMEFYRQSINRKTFEVTIKRIDKSEGVYCDQLQEIFTHVTGLYTSLGTLGI